MVAARRAVRVASGVIAFLLASCGYVFALNPALDIRQYGHTAWRVSDGFFRNGINAMAQTPDGYLWLGTENGLLRFDGVRAVAWQPRPNQSLPSNDIKALTVTTDGVLWIGTALGVASLRNGTLTNYPTLAGRQVATVTEGDAASVWMITYSPSSGLLVCTIAGGAVRCYGDAGGPGAGAISVYRDRNGRVWAGKTDGLWRMTPGAPEFFAVPVNPDGIAGLFEDDQDGLLYSAPGAIRRFVNGRSEVAYSLPPAMARSSSRAVFRDRDGGLWFGLSSGGGLVHIHRGVSDVFAKPDGLAADSATRIFEDREGNVWVAGLGGLDRFREPAVATFSADQGLSNSRVTSVLAGNDGSVWFGTFAGLNRFNDGRLTVYRGGSPSAPERRPGSRIAREVISEWAGGPLASIFQDRADRLWLSMRAGVGYLDNDRFVQVPGLPEGITRAIGEDRRGTLWIANQDLGLFHRSADTQTIGRISWSELNHEDPASAMAIDAAAGGVWLGFSEGGVVYFQDGKVRASYAAADGLATGRVRSLLLDASGSLWVATDGGLSLIKDSRVATLTVANGLPCDSIQWVVEDDARSLWLGSVCGLARIGRDALDAWWADAGGPRNAAHAVATTTFDSADGFRIISGNNYTDAAVKARDGKVWFLHADGVGVLDPQRLPVNKLPPPVFIELLTANRITHDVRFDESPRINLPPLVRDLQIDYTALSLVAPEKTRFRYMLEGRDTAWQDVGTRRQAFYTDLAPGQYRFHVVAANNSGVWNEAGATLEFGVAPALYQTNWFIALAAGMLLTLVWAAHRIRLRIVETHEREITALNEKLMSAQEQERIRIAGELHDGVMQEMLAATMMLGSAKRRISGDVEAQATIDKVQQKLVQAGTEIRQLSHDLHPPALQDAGLPDALRTHCEEFSASCGIPITCDADDRVHDLSRGAALALFRIVQEALGNAVKHSRATRITVGLARSAGKVTLTVSDDGIGFDRGRLTSSGGLGLITMRERAGQLNGTFEFNTAPGRGTTIKVVVPFR